MILMSAPSQILIEVKTDEKTCDFIQRALSNSAIQFQMESKEPLKIRLPATTNALSILVAIFEEKKSLVQGQIILPDGLSYEIGEKGLRELKVVLIQALARPQRPQDTTPQPTTHWIVDLLREGLKDPGATSKLVRELSSAFRGDPQTLITETKQVTNVTLAILLLLGGVIAATSILAGLGRISGDATGFIFGAILGSAFTFLQRYLVKPEEE